MNAPLEAAIIGLGWWGKNLVNAVQGRSARLRFVHGVSQEPDSVRDFAAGHGLRLSSTLADALADPRVKAVVLATPHSLHVEQVEAVARSGRAVFCEKPLAMDGAGARRAVAACQQAGVALGLGHNRRFWPAMQEMARRVAAGDLGQILHIEGHFSNENSRNGAFASWRDSEDESPAGGMTASGLHLLDAFVNLVGAVAQVDARLTVHKPRPAPLDTLSVRFDFESGATGYLAVVRATPRYWRCHVFGTRGSAEVVGELEPALVLRLSGQPTQRLEFTAIDTLREELERFADAASGGDPYPITPRQMIESVSAFEAIVASVAAKASVAVDNS